MHDIPVLPEGYKFHHIGYATNSIKREKAVFEFLGYSLDGGFFRDEVQGVEGCFMTGPGPRIELLENIPGSDTLTPWLESGIKMYHFAFSVNDINKAIEWSRTQRARVIVEPVSAVAFEGRKICFLMFRNALLIEFIEML